MLSIYKKFFNAVKRNKVEIFLSTGIFFGTILIGFIVSKVYAPINNNDYTSSYIKNFTTLSIIKNNLKVCIYLILGSLSLGLITIGMLFYNGFFNGMMLGIHSKTFDVFTILYKTVFHGIFELPAIIICGAIGIKTLIFCIRLLNGNGKKTKIKVHMKDSLILILFSFISIVFAGIIEGSLLPLFKI